MAVGDFVNDVYPINTTVNFQPAAGVTICLTHCVCFSQWIRLTDGVNLARVSYQHSNTSATNPQSPQIKLFINNTNYLNVPADASENTMYCGVQVS